MIVLLGSCACDSVTGPEEVPPEGTPRQFFLVEDPEIFLAERPNSSPPETQLAFRVTVPDSTAHSGWWPTRLLVETDRGYREELLLSPFACLEPSERFDEFPLNFEWLACNEIGINSTAVLSSEQIRQVEEMIDGWLDIHGEFQTQSGAWYFFFTGQVGRPAIREAIRRVEALDFIEGEVYHPTREPPCVTSDIVPPPPCPPWYLYTRRAFTLSEAAGDSIPVSDGGWIRATYTQPDGSKRVTTATFPPPYETGGS